MPSYPNLQDSDPALWHLMQQEEIRQHEHIELIASENYTSRAVMQAQGSHLTNKYAEGYPSKRYYGGCEFVDGVENLAIERLKALFGAEYANVQPHSGSQANQAVFFSVLKPGDKIMGMNLGHGGHLTHGLPANISGKLFQIVAYGVNEAGEIDYDEMARCARAERPKLIIGGASSFGLRFDWARMAEIAQEIGAYLMVDMAHYSGLIAAKLYPNPVPYADFVTSTTHKTLRGPRGGVVMAKAKFEKQLNAMVFPGLQGGPLMHVIAAKATAFLEASSEAFRSYQQQVLNNANVLAHTLMARGLKVIAGRTESHLFVLDMRSKGITGKMADHALGQAHITVNKNAIPNDPQTPFITSGIRIGTPAITTRGFAEAEVVQVAHLIADVLDAAEDASLIATVKAKVAMLTARFPVY
ncbi:MAG: serine hydroxymethyltransferase [Methylophilaceae bacterium]|nr:serine hydroxymethyltransferase [Methylophilaceae bacterium]